MTRKELDMNMNLNLENNGNEITNIINSLNIEEENNMKNTNTQIIKESRGNEMLFTSKNYYKNIFKILNHEKIEDDDAPKSFNAAFRRFIKEEVYGNGLYLLPTAITREMASDQRSIGFVGDGYGRFVFFDSGDNSKPDWDKKIVVMQVDNYETIPSGEGSFDLKEAGAKIRELFEIKEVF